MEKKYVPRPKNSLRCGPATAGNRKLLDDTWEQPFYTGNLQCFFASVAPAVPICTDDDGSADPRHFLLSDVWQSYEEWAAFGAEVPISLPMRVYGLPEVTQCYVPSLSAIQLYEPVETKAVDRIKSDYTSDEDLDSGLSDSTSVASSVIFTDSDWEDSCKGGGLHQAQHGSVLRKALGQPRKTLFQWVETANPHLREPLPDKIAELAEGVDGVSFPGLNTLRSCDVHPASWFAVAWYPIATIPSLGKGVRDLNASFLTFHSLATPSVVPLGPDEQAAGVPVPPEPTLAGEAMYTRREALASRMYGQNLAFLRPFGFMPYRMKGAIWSEDTMSAETSAALRAAALGWVDRHEFDHPDLEFFAQRRSSTQAAELR